MHRVYWRDCATVRLQLTFSLSLKKKHLKADFQPSILEFCTFDYSYVPSSCTIGFPHHNEQQWVMEQWHTGPDTNQSEKDISIGHFLYCGMSGEEYPCDFAKSEEWHGDKKLLFTHWNIPGSRGSWGGYSQYSDDRDDLRIFYGL